MTTNFSQTASYIWSLAELLRGDFKQSQYGRIILPFTILRRLECVLAPTKPKVLKEVEKLAAIKGLEEVAREKFLIKAAGQAFYNTSPMDLTKLGSADIKTNLVTYVESFSKDAREIFEQFRFNEFIDALQAANLLFKVVQRVAAHDLSPTKISNHDMGLVFEELIRKFAESSNETAGEHFTPRDIVRLTTSLVFTEDDKALTEEGIIHGARLLLRGDARVQVAARVCGHAWERSLLCRQRARWTDGETLRGLLYGCRDGSSTSWT
jgi:type I restriction enzyme M protein